MKLIFTSTGDYIDIVYDNSVLAEFWINEINKDNVNSFNLKDPVPLPKLDELTNNLIEVNLILAKFNIDDLTTIETNWHDQYNLNVLHERWVKLQHKHRNIVELLAKLPNNIVKKFHDINIQIHQIESTSMYTYENELRPGIIWQVKNPFDTSILKSGKWNVELHYQNLGRSLYDKWKNFDNNIFDEDTNNFTHIGGRVIINLDRPYTVGLPNEYIEYCSQHNTTPIADILPLGNFLNIEENLTKIRQVIYRNINDKNNRISFEI